MSDKSLTLTREPDKSTTDEPYILQLEFSMNLNTLLIIFFIKVTPLKYIIINL
jgi:hypothetical protein